MQTNIIRIHETGGPGVLRWETAEIGEPGRGEVRLRHTAIGVNFTDTYNRTGLYKNALPVGLGFEAAGVVEAVGPEADGLKPGDRVAYSGGPIGAYAEARLYPANRLVPLPHWIADEIAAGSLLRGMTVEFLLQRTYAVKKGEFIVVHAAAGALGIIMCQWANFIGAQVIGTAGSADKVAVAQANGATHVLVTGDPEWPAKIRAITDGVGAAVVYDGVGRDTFDGSLACLARRGMMVSFGSASGPVPAVKPSTLNDHGSLFLTRPKLWDYIATRQELMESAACLFDMIHREAVKPAIAARIPLKDAAEAHRLLESRKALGAIILMP